MTAHKAKISDNIRVNFNSSPEIHNWSKRYHISIDQMQEIFNRTGNSISKTLEVLRSYELAGTGKGQLS